jgi:hypothetical protein
MGVESILAPFVRQADLCKLTHRSWHQAPAGRVAVRRESALRSARIAVEC